MGRKITIWLLIAVSVAGLALVWCRGDGENVGSTGPVSAYREDEALYFSREAGFYDEPFYLEIIAPTKEIYYTLDGTDPDRNSLRYTGPIWIEDASKNENIHSARTDVSFRYYDLDEDGNFRLTDSYYKLPEENVDKCTILKAAYYDVLGGRSEIRCASYFVGFDQKEGYSGCKVISLITDPDNLFDDEKGIYVLGDSFKRYAEQTESNREMRENQGLWLANFIYRGREWEREVSLQFFDTDGTLLLTQKGGARVHGNMSRDFAAKSLNLYARKEYSGSGRFPYDFWDTGYSADKMTLHNGGNHINGTIQNPLVAGLTGNLNFSLMNYDVYVLFLDGEYWGVYNLTEKYDADFISYYYSVPKDDVLMVKNGELEDGKESDFHLYQEAMAFAEKADLTDHENYRKCSELFDMDSLLDYFATGIYCARVDDWPHYNFALWRTVTVSGSPYGDGKWRWMLFDMDSHGMTEDLIDNDTVQSACNDSALFANLCTNEEFRRAFGERILEIGRTCFDPARVEAALDEYNAFMEEPMTLYFKRFFGTDNSWFQETVNSNRAFFENRYEAVTEILRTHDMLPE